MRPKFPWKCCLILERKGREKEELEGKGAGGRGGRSIESLRGLAGDHMSWARAQGDLPRAQLRRRAGASGGAGAGGRGPDGLPRRGREGDALQDLSDRNLLPSLVFEARNDALATHAASSPATVAAYAPHQESPFLRSPSKPLTRRDEIEAESVLDAQNVQVSYAQMMTRLGLDSLQGKPLQDCLRSSLAELEGFCLKRSYQLGGLCRKMMHNTMKYVSYKQAASEVRQEAATWCLLRHSFEEPVLREAAGGGGDAMDLGDGGD